MDGRKKRKEGTRRRNGWKEGRNERWRKEERKGKRRKDRWMEGRNEEKKNGGRKAYDTADNPML